MTEPLTTIRNEDQQTRPGIPGRTDLTGQILMQKLRVVRLLGEGGMGAVYEVEHLITRHRRALKVMHARYAGSKESITRFIREAGVAGTLKTPHVVETYDAGQLEDGAPYVLMELLEGEPLAALLDRGAVGSGRIVGLVCQVLEGLGVAHDAGIVHRDIKPDNLFVSKDDRGGERVRVLDFGISKFAQDGSEEFSGTLTAEGAMMGTPFYMSPEQASGAKKVDERSDLYSVAVVLYEGLSGRRPFDGHNLPSLIIKIHSGEHVPLDEIAPHIPGELATIVERAMSVDPERRPASARAFLAQLMPYAESHYTSSLKTLREVAGDAQTVYAPAMSMPPRASGVPEKSKAGPSIHIDLPTSRPGWRLPAALAAGAALLALVGWAIFSVGAPPASAPPSAPVVASPPPVLAEPPVVAAPVVPAVVEEPPAEVAPATDPSPVEVALPAPEERPRVRTAPREESPRADEEEEEERPRSGRTKILRGGVY